MAKRMRWIVLLLIAGMFIFSLAGCGGQQQTSPPPTQEQPAPQEPALDPQEVLKQAAKDYFAHIAAGNNNITDFVKIKEMLDDNPDSALIIDIRSGEDFEKGHIPGAVHVDRGKVAEIMDRIPRNKPVFVTCYTGQNAGYTVAYLRMAGFENVTSMFYGIDLGWVERGKFTLDETGMVSAFDLPPVSSPRTPEEEIIWNRAGEYAAEIAAGQIGFIGVGDPQKAFYEELQANPMSAVVYDIRAAKGEAHDYDTYHIEHSKHVPWGQFGDVLEELPTNVPVVIGCYSGQTAAQTLGVLRMLGFDNARSILYGVRDGWVAKSELPVVKP
ncbi:rhodanese-like domain-containing protein [Desulfitibacter alkalitolerans]|uniref:rhodanese-like domain-containing protein n=1 Tax=Desulfitibacter alkalitolerans TaxID=264641 RepID=UPI0004863045|nr:rhodanese-like domain-containing protein [Desulfitibacter alkalitolerans]